MICKAHNCSDAAMGWGETPQNCPYHSAKATAGRHRAGFEFEIGERVRHHDVLENQGSLTQPAFVRQRLEFITGRPYGHFAGITFESLKAE